MDCTRFESIGVYLPEKVVTTQELIDQMRFKPPFDLEDLTGIRERRWRGKDEDSHSLAVSAAQKCIANSQYEAEDLDIIIFCSITRFKKTFYQMEPALSKSLKVSLGMRSSAINFDISNACAGMMSGVYILDSMIKAGTVRTGMVVSGECITPITETAVKESREIVDPQFASLTVGDSGAACIIDEATDNTASINSLEMLCLSKYADLCIGMPSNQNPGVAMYTDSLGIHNTVKLRFPAIMRNYMLNNNLSLSDDIDFVIPHQTSVRAIKAVADGCFKIMQNEEPLTDINSAPETLISVDKYGNTSSTSHFVVLHEYLKKGKIKKGSQVLFLVMASGIMLGAIKATIGDMEVN